MESFASQKKDIKSMTLDELRADMKIRRFRFTAGSIEAFPALRK